MEPAHYFFTSRWVSQFTTSHDLILLPETCQAFFDEWEAACQTPPCFLHDRNDRSGQQYYNADLCIKAFNKVDQAYQNLCQLLQRMTQPMLDKRMVNKLIKAIQKNTIIFHQHGNYIHEIAKTPPCNRPPTMPKAQETRPLRSWLRSEYLSLMKATLRQVRIHYFWKKTALFQKQCLFLYQNPYYWVFLTDRIILDDRQQRISRITSQKSDETNDNQLSKNKKSLIAQEHINRLLKQHQSRAKLAGFPTELSDRLPSITPYHSVFSQQEQASTKNRLNHLRQIASLSSNQYQIMSHDQLNQQLLFAHQLLEGAALMYHQITRISWGLRISRALHRFLAAIINPIARQLFGHNFMSSTTLSPSVRQAMLNDITSKRLHIQGRADHLLQAMLDRILLCTFTQSFTADDTLWHIHTRMSKQGLVIFSAKPIHHPELCDTGSKNVFIRQSQTLEQIADMCHHILHFPYESPTLRKIQGQLKSLPLLTALPHLHQKQHGNQHARALYYDQKLWETIFQLHIVLFQSHHPSQGQLKKAESSLHWLKQEYEQRYYAIPFLSRHLPSVSKAYHNLEKTLDLLQRQYLMRKQHHLDHDYDHHIHEQANNIAQYLRQGKTSSARSAIGVFSESDVAFVPINKDTPHQTYISLESSDIAESLVCILETSWHQQLPWNPKNFQESECYLAQLTQAQKTLAEAWPSVAERLRGSFTKQKARIAMLSTCNPWHHDNSLAKTCENLTGDKKIISMVKTMLPITVGACLDLEMVTGTPKLMDKTLALLRFCQLNEAASALRSDTHSSKYLPEALTPLTQAYMPQHRAQLTQIKTLRQHYPIALELFCDHLCNQALEPWLNKSNISLNGNGYLAAFQQLIEDFSAHCLLDLACLDHCLPEWLRKHPHQEDSTTAQQYQLLGLPPAELVLPDLITTTTKLALLYLSQRQRAWNQFLVSPPTQSVFMSFIHHCRIQDRDFLAIKSACPTLNHLQNTLDALQPSRTEDNLASDYESHTLHL